MRLLVCTQILAWDVEFCMCLYPGTFSSKETTAACKPSRIYYCRSSEGKTAVPERGIACYQGPDICSVCLLQQQCDSMPGSQYHIETRSRNGIQARHVGNIKLHSTALFYTSIIFPDHPCLSIALDYTSSPSHCGTSRHTALSTQGSPSISEQWPPCD